MLSHFVIFRQSLLAKILNKGKASEGTLTLEEQEKKALEVKQKQAALVEEELDQGIDDDEVLQDVGFSSVKDADLQTTLLVSTVYPENLRDSSSYLEVATIRSPYSFNIEDGMSTRYYLFGYLLLD